MRNLKMENLIATKTSEEGIRRKQGHSRHLFAIVLVATNLITLPSASVSFPFSSSFGAYHRSIHATSSSMYSPQFSTSILHMSVLLAEAPIKILQEIEVPTTKDSYKPKILQEELISTKVHYKPEIFQVKGPSSTKSNYKKIERSKVVKRIPLSPNKSSTMPGFRNRGNTGRRVSFRDGLEIAQDANRPEVASQIKVVLTSKTETKKRAKVNSESMYSNSACVPESMIDFTTALHKESRITPQEECELGTRTKESMRIQKIYDKLETDLDRKPTDAEWCAAAGKINVEALRQALDDGLEAKNRLVTSNLRMVQGVVNLYIRNGLGSQFNAGDLMQEGSIALIRAAEKFDPQRGFRFSTYAMYWIRSAVKKSQIYQSRLIHIPTRLHETHKKVLLAKKTLNEDLGRNPSQSEVADAVGVTAVQLDRCMKGVAQECYSLDADVENSLKPNNADVNKDTLYDVLDKKYAHVDENLKSTLMKQDLVRALKSNLQPKEVDILLLRYGLMDEVQKYGLSGPRPLTIAQVSNCVGLKPDKVRRTINNSLLQLRHIIAPDWHDFERELP